MTETQELNAKGLELAILYAQLQTQILAMRGVEIKDDGFMANDRLYEHAEKIIKYIKSPPK